MSVFRRAGENRRIAWILVFVALALFAGSVAFIASRAAL
jgi:hypothetical protein